MRTTIELSDEHRSILHSLAAQRGLRGYSKVIQEAIEHYVREKIHREKTLRSVLKMRGSWNREDAQKLRKRIEEIRRNWKIT